MSPNFSSILLIYSSMMIVTKNSYRSHFDALSSLFFAFHLQDKQRKASLLLAYRDHGRAQRKQITSIPLVYLLDGCLVDICRNMYKLKLRYCRRNVLSCFVEVCRSARDAMDQSCVRWLCCTAFWICK